MSRSKAAIDLLVRTGWRMTLARCVHESPECKDFLPAQPGPRNYYYLNVAGLARFVADNDPILDESGEDYQHLEMSWYRDIRNWLKELQTVSPDKIRRFCVAIGSDWLRAL